MSVSYRTDLDKARRLVPEPLEVLDPIVTLTFPDHGDLRPGQVRRTGPDDLRELPG
ncbi:acetoacetate decarboxylase family protein [Amycolatopsis sp. FDAARGOS 1241]|uniref:acetoacetate decarboxylase family protein n=1 Tax=Amycolatopsis sp. FDAARGOS 1241 TaxID=2778070 RepID=UPI00351C16E4